MSTTMPEPVKDDTAPVSVPDGTSTPSIDQKAKNKPKPHRTALRVLTPDQASTQALRTGKAVETAKIFTIPCATIKGYNNPRHEPAHLFEMGYDLIAEPDVSEPVFEGEEPNRKLVKYASLMHMALSDNHQLVAQFVKLVREHESVNRKHDAEAPQSICELADEIALCGQWVPIYITPNNIMGDGGRRLCAILLLHAESKLKRWNKEKDAPSKVFPATIQATHLKANAADLFRISVKINLSRKQFDPLQEGRVYAEMLQQINPKTKQRYTMKEAAEELMVPYGTFRNRRALCLPRNEAQGKGLTDADRKAVREGRLTVTAASRKALGEKHYSPTGAPKNTRAKPIPLVEMQRKFDETRANNIERRQAIAECMGLTLAQAIRQSLDRQEAQVDRAENRNNRKNNKNRRGRAA